jgi:hypothetical protein
LQLHIDEIFSYNEKHDAAKCDLTIKSRIVFCLVTNCFLFLLREDGVNPERMTGADRGALGMRARTLSFIKFTISAAAFVAASVVPAMANDTLNLLASGHRLSITPETGVAFTVEFSPDGTYKTSHGSSGTWKVDGDKLCTIRASDNVSSCGVFPTGKKRGDAWATKDASRRNVTVTILAPTKSGG